ncbi:MAG: 8-oxo-dGTP pyrophosphatase MutT (NUDIX family) [Phenylobacterium sp.]|jgi:8-oxo-dGTP pyrophosphatase MutT (NUDIX family)
MNKTQFKWSFVLSPLATKQQKLPPTLTKAAVLIPMIERDNQLFVLLTQRATHLKHHPGQVSFPGGRFETSDHSLATTALRETHEEVGISPDKVEIIGQLNNYQTISKYVVTPFVGFVSADYQASIDKNEVDAVFEVPWTFFLHRVNYHHLNIRRFGRSDDVHFMPFKDRFIWGTTAAMIHDLVCHFE